MLIKCQLRIKCQTEMFMFGKLFNDDLIKNIGGWAGLFLLQENITLAACLFTSRLNCIFHWKAHGLIRLKALFKAVAEVSSSGTTAKRSVSSAKSLASELMLSTRSLIQAKKNNGPKTEPWGTPALMWRRTKFFQLSTTRCCLSDIKFSNGPKIPLDSSLCRRSSCHALTKAWRRKEKPHEFLLSDTFQTLNGSGELLQSAD